MRFLLSLGLLPCRTGTNHLRQGEVSLFKAGEGWTITFDVAAKEKGPAQSQAKRGYVQLGDYSVADGHMQKLWVT